MAGEAARLDRRSFVTGLAALPLAGCGVIEVREQNRLSRSLYELEKRAGGRLGLFVLDTAEDGRGTLGTRITERFGLTSTFKLPLAAVVLAEIQVGALKGDELIRYTADDLVPHHPVTGPNVDRGMTILALAEAAQVTSDNVAANLLLKRLGGPARFTAALGNFGDNVTRLDRYEPELNLVPPGEERDTTTPYAMAMLTAQILTGDTLSSASRDTLIGWMVKTQSGAKRLRAGLPANWRAGDKTGTAAMAGMVSKINDVAVAWPPGRAPIVIAAYYDAPVAEFRPRDEAVLAEVGRIAAEWAA